MDAIHAALEGLGRAEASLERTAQRIARAPVSLGPAGDSVSLSDLAVSLVEARDAYAMNLRTLETSNQMQKRLLDVLG